MAFIRNFLNMIPTLIYMGPGYAVGIATGYGLDDLWIESSGGEIFRTLPDRPWAHAASYTAGTGSYPEVKRPGAWR